MSVAYKERSAAELQAEYSAVKAEYDALKARDLKLNMSRGKPSKAQLDMVSDMMDVFKSPEDYVSDGIDVRNYGELAGLPAAKRLFAELLGCRPGSCAFSVQRRTRTEAGVVYEFTQSLIRADRVKLDIFLHKDGVSFTRSVDK